MPAQYNKSDRVNSQWVTQDPAGINQSSPGHNAWYTVLEVDYGYLHRIAYRVTDTDETIEVRLTVEGRVISAYSNSAVADTNYVIYRNISALGRIDQTKGELMGTHLEENISLRYMGSLKVEIRKTTNNGNGDLNCVVEYDLQRADL